MIERTDRQVLEVISVEKRHANLRDDIPSDKIPASSSTSLAVFLRLSSLGKSRAILIKKEAAKAAQTSNVDQLVLVHDQADFGARV